MATKSLTNAKAITINGKAVKQIKDLGKDSVIWSASGDITINDTFIGNGESLFFSPAAENVSRAIVRGTCSLSSETATPENPAVMSCNNGEMQFVDGVLEVSGSPSYFDINEDRANPVDLFGWGYADEQNLQTGVITRKVMVSAMRASWGWVTQSVSGASYFALPKADYPLLVCTHFHQVGTATPANVGEWCEGAGDYLLFNYDGTNDDIVAFEDYLEDCYLANEAVICLTKRLIDITENEQPFAVAAVKGLNRIEYTANDDSNVVLKYRALYPADNKIWYETTDGTEYLTIRNQGGGFKNDLGESISFVSSKYLGNNIWEEEYDEKLKQVSSAQFRGAGFPTAKLKRIWLPQTLFTGSTPFFRLELVYNIPTLENVYTTPSIWDLNKENTWSDIFSASRGNLKINVRLRSSNSYRNFFIATGRSVLDVTLVNDNFTFDISSSPTKAHCTHFIWRWQGNVSNFRNLINAAQMPKFNYFLPEKYEGVKNRPNYNVAKFKVFPIPDCWL